MSYAHIQIGARDVRALVSFYDVLLSRLGWVRGVEPDQAGPAGVFWRHADRRDPEGHKLCFVYTSSDIR